MTLIVDRRMTKLEEDDMSTVAFRSVNETVISEDNSKKEKLNLLAEGFVLPERSDKYRLTNNKSHFSKDCFTYFPERLSTEGADLTSSSSSLYT